MPIDANLANWNKENGPSGAESPKDNTTLEAPNAHQWREAQHKYSTDVTNIRFTGLDDDGDEKNDEKYMEELLDLCGWHDDQEKPPPKSYLQKCSSVNSTDSDSDDDDEEIFWNHRDSEETITDHERKWAASSSTMRRKSSTRLDLTRLSLKSKLFDEDDEDLGFGSGYANQSVQKPPHNETTSAATTGRKALSPITNTMQQQQPGRGNDASQRTRNATATLTRKTTDFGYDLEDEFDWANLEKVDASRKSSLDSGIDGLQRKATFGEEDFWGDMESVVF
ncbi:hypothetical protein AAVH_06711 [Aphelenchoides avenae]|nr:hypothetical protein AAVH_32007 [Aphelenchus avenae]KAH7725868.1 hypothetical protein AAVH_06711 [Aphelenchus avenae]